MNRFYGRRFIIQGLIFLMLLLLAARLFYIQIIDKSYRISAANNVIREITVYPSRGLIYDRQNQILVQNNPVYDLMVIYHDIEPFDTLALCQMIHLDKAVLLRKLAQAKKTSPLRGFLIEKQLSAETYASLQERLFQYPGFYVQNRSLRKYPHASSAHVLGYIGEVNSAHIRKGQGYYRSGDYIGINGLEHAYESVIRGKRGIRRILVDARNQEKGAFKNGKYDTLALQGQPITSSLDLRIQKLGEELLQNKMGSIVAIEPQTGEILAFVSAPYYDPNRLVGRVRNKNYKILQKDALKPLFNRPIQAQYPPGSIFKSVMALIALQAEAIDLNTIFVCTGKAYVGRARMGCDHVHGKVNLITAIQKSCNVYFAYAFQRLIDFNKTHAPKDNYAMWHQRVSAFGAGQKLGVDIPSENKGVLASKSYYDKLYRGSWSASTVLSLSIGQGEMGLTPLQMANIVAILANRGYYYRPHLVTSIGKNKYTDPLFKKKISVEIDSNYFNPVIEGMSLAVKAGTAWRARLKDIEIAGKTGTVQNPHGENHATFFGFAPKEQPKIAIAVFVENAGYGSKWAAPIASMMIEKYLKDTVSKTAEYTRIKHAIILPNKK